MDNIKKLDFKILNTDNKKWPNFKLPNIKSKTRFNFNNKLFNKPKPVLNNEYKWKIETKKITIYL